MGLSTSCLRMVSGGIDYLTLTSTRQHTLRQMAEYFNGVLLDDKLLGFLPKRGGAFGFFGQKTRHALLATKEERTMLQVTGKAAQRTMLLANAGDNCTRLDIQATVRIEGDNVSEAMESIWRAACAAPAVRGHKPKPTYRGDESGKQTIYIGERSSEIYIRIYDKWAECHEEWARGCIRYEVEIKGKTSKALWEKCANEGLGTAYLLTVLRFCLERRGIVCDGIDWAGLPEALPLKEKTSLERTRGWIATQVAPALARMSAEWGWFTAFTVAFDRCLTEMDKSLIMNAWARNWGD